MKFSLIAVGTNMPAWVQTGFKEYQKRLPREYKLECVEIAIAKGSKNTKADLLKEKEGQQLLAKVSPSTHVIALDLTGRSLSTERLAQRLETWQMNAKDVALLIGGPNGLAQACIDRADEVISLSALTLPHPIVRIVIAEQLYRAHTILTNHPYHK